MEWVLECVPSWPNARGCRASGTASHRDKAQRGYNQWTRRHRAESIPILKWLQAPGNGASRRSCCDARDRMWHCQNRWDARQSSSPGGNLSSTQPKTTGNKVLNTWWQPKAFNEFNFYLFGIVRNVVVGIDKEDVLGFEVGVSQLVVVQETDGVRQLVANMTYLVQRVRLVVVVLLKFE